ncbi:hypothetical protein FNV43_RR26268 [Rhamnella rubrinervis]|uniref:Glycosyltransferase 61 catalytic domain-containing protein n=1 Tax=Rhamnella rubrinervis TaxID=2594499 RepID=A0A8K0DI97_9ROSA|nr:hypothetical protein FNV43_RR26268 [Rhamnella rubrinervis]
MKKKGSSLTAAACFGLLVVIFILLHIAFTSLTDTIAFQEFRRWKLILGRTLSPLSKPAVGSIRCDRSHKKYDLCSVNGTTLLDPSALTLYELDSTPPATSFTVRPYPRKTDKTAMSKVKDVTLTSTSSTALCQVTHSSPALVFSVDGYTGNFYHSFNEGIIPLFVTVNSVFPNQNITLVVTDSPDWWVQKYAELLSQITIHPIINTKTDQAAHCFPSAIVGLISHGEMTVDPNRLPQPKTLVDFRAFLRKAYNNGSEPESWNRHRKSHKPRMVVVSRKGNVGRVMLNQNQVVKAAEKVGFEVVVFEPSRKTSLNGAFRLIENSNAMLGVHGAALTHSLFLRPGSILLQVVPIGTEWLARTCFEQPAKAMGVEYMKYAIGVDESSLVEKYGRHSMVLRNPRGFANGNWSKVRVYLKAQNVKVDLVRFRHYLTMAYVKAKRFMEKEDY